MSLKAEVLAAVREHPGNLSLTEIGVRERRFAELPDELYEMAEQMSPAGATLEAKLTTAKRIITEAMKLADAWPGDGPATRIAAAVKPPASADGKPLSSTESRPDIMLSKLANEIRLSENVGYGEALSRAKQRDPELAKRYAGGRFADPAPASATDRPDVELAERAKARAEKDGVDYGKAMSLELAENPDLASRYHDRRGGGAVPGAPAKVETPPGMRRITERPDVQLAARVKARQESDGVDYGSAMTLELTEDPALASRYADYQAGRTAIDEATYRAETIRAAHHGRFSLEKAFNAALAEDPKLRAGVDAYYVRT